MPTSEHKYCVTGLHCASCELLVEKKLLKIKGVKSVEVSAGKGEAIVYYEGSLLDTEKLNQIFQEDGYKFYNVPKEKPEEVSSAAKGVGRSVLIALIFIVGFLLLGKSRVTELVSVNSNSSLPMFFVFGLLAGISSCAALVGGMILSLSKKWTRYKARPHILFNAGRLLSFAVMGAVLGEVGSRLQVSLSLASILVIVVSAMMIVFGLQMIGVRALAGFSITVPKFITRRIANEDNFQGEWLPFLLGATTFFLPCGFTITTQGLALLSGDLVRGSLIMTAFALGTLPVLIFIGFSSARLFKNPHWSQNFSQVAGILVLFFAVFNINSQLNRLGLPSFSDFGYKTAQKDTSSPSGLPAVVGGKQIIRMSASSSGYSPNYFKVMVGIPVRWEITDKGTSGCTNAIISRGLFADSIPLTPGQVSVKEFTPTVTGQYKFSCWMGMVSGIIEVVDKSGTSGPVKVNSQPISSGASGCGCGAGKQ